MLIWKRKCLACSRGITCVLTSWHKEALGGSKSLPTGHPQANEESIFFFSLLLLGAVSAARESWEYDSGARDLHSPDLQSQSALQKLLEYGGSSSHQQAATLHKLLSQAPRFGSSVGGSYLELANTVSTFRFTERVFRPVCISTADILISSSKGHIGYCCF